MAGTVQSGNIGTEEVLTDERVIDMDEKIRVLFPDDTPFTTMINRISDRQAIREKVNWLEEEDFPRIVTGDAQTSGATALNLSLGIDPALSLRPGPLRSRRPRPAADQREHGQDGQKPHLVL